MGRTSGQKARNNARNDKKRKLGLRPARNPNQENRRKHKKPQPQSEDPILFGPDSDDYDSEAGAGASFFPDPDESPSQIDVQNLLEPYTKEHLIEFLCDGALADPTLLAKIRAIADRDVAHRKIFVHGLGWDATKEDILGIFSLFGPIEDCNVVVDKATGRAKGYGFVLFESRSGATRALKQPQKTIKNRVASCQLASMGPTASAAAGHHADTAGRKIYISNVHADASPDKLQAFFAKFGEIESGPMGFDTATGKSKGYALFVYRTQEGARKVLEEPYKMFEGHQLHCQRATEPSKLKEVVSAVGIPMPPTDVGLVGAAPQNVLAAVAAAQNFTLFNQNPAYAALLSQNPLLASAASLNSAAMNPAVLNPAMGAGLGGYIGSSSVLGAYGAQSTAGFQGSQYGQQSSLGRPGGSYGGMSSYL